MASSKNHIRTSEENFFTNICHYKLALVWPFPKLSHVLQQNSLPYSFTVIFITIICGFGGNFLAFVLGNGQSVVNYHIPQGLVWEKETL